MTIKQDWQLKYLGIATWTLKPSSIKLYRNLAIKLPDYIRLLIITNKPFQTIDHPLVMDIARSMTLTKMHLYGITPEQSILISDSINYNCWWLGVKATRNFSGINFQTPSIEEFARDSRAKRALWCIFSNI